MLPRITRARVVARALRTTSFVAVGLLFAACNGSELTGPSALEPPTTVPGGPLLPPIAPNGAILVNCSVNVPTGRLSCGGPAGGPTLTAANALIVGGQNVYVRLTATNGPVTATTCDGTASATKRCIRADVTVENLITQPMGTTDGTTPDGIGVQVFFANGPTTTAGTGQTTVPDAQPGFFTDANQLAFTYPGALLGDGILAPNETSAALQWSFESDVSVTTFSFGVYVSAAVPKPNGYIDVSPAVTSVARGGTTTLSAIGRHPVGRALTAGEVAGGITYASSDEAVATVNATTGEVTGVANGVATITASQTRSNSAVITGTSVVTVTSAAPVALDETYGVQMGIPLAVAGAGVLANDTDADDASGLVAAKLTDPSNGTVTLSADGTFTYTPSAGFTGGDDTFTYTVSDGSTSDTATVTLSVSGRTWWVDSDNTGAQDGRKASPFVSLTAAQAVAVAGDTIFLSGGGSGTGSTLKASQVIIGQGIPAAVTRTLTATTATQDQSVTLLATGSKSAVGGTVALATDNVIRGVAITAASGAAITGTSFTTLAVSATDAVATAGRALALDGGTVTAAFGTLSASGSADESLTLDAVDGSITADAGTLASAIVVMRVAGGDVDFTYGGNLTQSGTVMNLLSVSGSHTGTLTFTGTVSATAGSGLQFNSANGTYVFSGTTTLSGGIAAIDITNGSTGTFTFGTGTTITSPAGSAILVYGSAPTVTYSGNITQANNALLVEIGEVTGGSVTFQTGTLSATNGEGISLSNADGAVSFNGTTTLNGGDAGVDVVSGSNGTIAFGTGASITNPTGTAFVLAGGSTSANATYAGTIAANAGLAVFISGVSGGLVTLSGDITSSAMGIDVTGNTGGTVRFTGTTRTLSTGANTAVNIATNSGATIILAGVTDLTTTTGTAFSATDGGTIAVGGLGSSDIVTTTGSALYLDGVTVHPGGIRFATVNTGAAATPVRIANLGTSGGAFVTVSGGAIPSGNGARVAIIGGAAPVSWGGTLTQAANFPLATVSSGHTGSVTFTNTLSATAGSGLDFNNADGTYNFTGAVSLNGGDAHVDVSNGSAGTITFANASVTNPVTTAALRVNASAPTLTWAAGSITNTANGRRPVDIQSNTGGSVAIGASINSTQLGILVQNNTGGTYSFSSASKTLNTGVNTAVALTNNTGATISFTGGGLAITTTSGGGINATGGGTVNVTGDANVVASVGGIAVNVTSTSIGASGMTFRSISANGGANGIALSGTGTSGFFTVTGNGGRCDSGVSTCSGGLIQSSSGTDGAVSGNGIYLNGTRNVSLGLMRVTAIDNNGLFGTGVRGLTVSQMLFNGNIGTSNSGTFNESPVQLVDLGGGVKFSGSRFDGGAMNGVRITNSLGTAPTLDSLIFVNDTVSFLQGSTADVRGTAMLIDLHDGSAPNVQFRNNRVTFWWGNAIHVLMQGTASGVARINGNFADNTNGALAGAGGIWVGGCNLAYNISSNVVRNTNGTAISADKANCGSATLQGTIDSNQIGVAGVANSGSGTGIGIFASGRNGTTKVRISNNVIRQINGSANGAITTVVGDAAGFGGLVGTLDATIVGNDIQESGTTYNAAQQGIFINHGVTSSAPGDSHAACYDVLSNSITNFNTASATPNRIRVQQRFTGVSRWPGYTGGNADNAALGAYLLGRNTASNQAVSNNTFAGGGGHTNTTPAGSACAQPSM